FIAMGDLAPGEKDVFLPMAAGSPSGNHSGLIQRNFDVTYVEHYQRGREDFPEDLPAIFEWMGHRKREPFPKDEVRAMTARESDDRFFGAVVREWIPGKTVAPELADMLGKNIKPASVTTSVKRSSTLLVVTTAGVRKLDLWLSPRQLDFSKKIE